MRDDFLFNENLFDLDPNLHELIQVETERQYKKLILIPSESLAPSAVREALGSTFQNIYAEGYPDEATRWMTEEQLLEYPARLAFYRRYSDGRYYKGVEYVDVVEALARRRCAELFATDNAPADSLFVNVQALSGAPANNAVYQALIQPGDTILGMNLLHGGHLSHGSPVNRSGKLYNAVHYKVNPETEKIDYEEVAALANEFQPKVIIAGYSSYPWVPDWAKFRKIADSVGAFLLADISHIAGLVAAGTIPSPVGYAHVITFTTHKTLCGPRGACIVTQDPQLAKKIDRAVFPGEQGGPHIHAVAALALTFKLAKTEKFKQLQYQIVKNCYALTARLKERGLRIPFGGSDTHLGNIDCKSIKGPDGTPLSGDMAARILDIAGIVLNRNTIPGDVTATKSSGIRYGTPWMTQRGLIEEDMVKVADIIADVLFATEPYQIQARKGYNLRTKIDFDVLEDAKIRVRELAKTGGQDIAIESHHYPHFFYLDDQPQSNQKWSVLEISSETVLQYGAYSYKGNSGLLQESQNIKYFMNYAFASDVEALAVGESKKTILFTPKQSIEGSLTLLRPGFYHFTLPTEKSTLAQIWLRDLSDGFTKFDSDLLRRIPGPVTIKEVNSQPTHADEGETVFLQKPFYVGFTVQEKEIALPEFRWEAPEEKLMRTPLYETHKNLGAKLIPFAGWEMPVWYTSVMEEHLATRQAAGLFDVAHMGVYQCEGPDAFVFLDCVCGNDISALGIGESCYTHFLSPDAEVIDDLLVYRRSQLKYLVVVNASNDNKDWTWLNAVHNGEVRVDGKHPWVRSFGRNSVLRNLRDPKEGKDMKVDIALQGRISRDILLSLGCSTDDRNKIMSLKRTNLCEATVGGFDLVVSRTGYTGERMAFELFVHPDQAADLWSALMVSGTPMGLKPCGLGARDSLRTEAGLPLYEHEMGGKLGLGVGEAGFGWYVKTYKPWFIGRDAFLERELNRSSIVVRFRFAEKAVRMAHSGDPVLDDKGRVIGTVTSCAIDSEGWLTGQAYLQEKYSAEGNSIFIYQGAPESIGKPPSKLTQGDRIKLPTQAIILSRFPKL